MKGGLGNSSIKTVYSPALLVKPLLITVTYILNPPSLPKGA